VDSDVGRKKFYFKKIISVNWKTTDVYGSWQTVPKAKAAGTCCPAFLLNENRFRTTFTFHRNLNHYKNEKNI